jgi:hypothetical protein
MDFIVALRSLTQRQGRQLLLALDLVFGWRSAELSCAGRESFPRHFFCRKVLMSGQRLQLLQAICFAGGLSICAQVSLAAESQDTPAQASGAEQMTTSDEDSSYNGSDLTRPQRSLVPRLQFRETSNETSRTDQGRAILQYNSKIDLNSQWRLSFQAQLPFIDKRTTMLDRSGSENVAGLGNIIAQTVLIQTIDTHWAYGFGVRMAAPAPNEDVARDRWQVYPGFGVRYSFLELGTDTYFVPAIRYAVSFGGNPMGRNVNEPQIAPTFNIGLPSRWFITLFPSYDIRVNFGDRVSGQTGRAFIPFDFAVGKTILDNLTTSLEISIPVIKDYPVYDFKTELKVTWRF